MSKDIDFKMVQLYPYHITDDDGGVYQSFLIIQPQGNEPKEGDPVLGITSVGISDGPVEGQYYIEIEYSYFKGAEKAGLM